MKLLCILLDFHFSLPKIYILVMGVELVMVEEIALQLRVSLSITWSVTQVFSWVKNYYSVASVDGVFIKTPTQPLTPF